MYTFVKTSPQSKYWTYLSPPKLVLCPSVSPAYLPSPGNWRSGFCQCRFVGIFLEFYICKKLYLVFFFFLVYSQSCASSSLSNPRTFASPQKKPSTPLAVTPGSLPPPPSPWQPRIYFLSLWICLFWTFYVNGIIQYLVFCDWILSLSIMFSRFIHAVYLSVLHYSFMAE